MLRIRTHLFLKKKAGKIKKPSDKTFPSYILILLVGNGNWNQLGPIACKMVLLINKHKADSTICFVFISFTYERD